MSDLITQFAGAAYTTDTSGIQVGDNDQTLRVRDVEQGIVGLNRDDGTFHRFLSMLGAPRVVIQPKFEITEDDVDPQGLVVSTLASSSATSVVVNTGHSYQLVENSRVRVQETGEILYLDAAPTYSTDTLTVTRGFASSAAKAIPAGSHLIPLGDSLAELGSANSGNGSIPTERDNYISTISKSFDLSWIQQNTTMRGGIGTVPRESARVMLNAKRQVNADLIYGKKSRVASPSSAGDGLVYTTDGFLSFVKDNHLDLGGNNGLLEWPILNEFLRPQFTSTNSSDVKFLFCGESLFSAFSYHAYARHNFVPEFETELGSTFVKIVTDQGQHVMVVLDKYGFSAAYGAAGTGIIVDPAHVGMVELQNKPLMWRQNIQSNDAHNRKDEVFGTYGLDLRYQQTMGFITGASGLYS